MKEIQNMYLIESVVQTNDHHHSPQVRARTTIGYGDNSTAVIIGIPEGAELLMYNKVVLMCIMHGPCGK